MLREILDVAQDDPSSQRRWFHDEYFDLFVLQSGGELAAFQLCYGIDSNERALVWSRDRGFFHDGGPSGTGEFIGAGIVPGDSLDSDPIIARFEQAAGGLPETLRVALKARLHEYALQDADGAARRARFRRAAWQQAGREQRSK